MAGNNIVLTQNQSSYRRVLNVSLVTAYGLARFLIYLLTWVTGFIPSWVMGWLRWCPTSSQDLELAEEKVLSYVKKPFKGEFVNIGNIDDHCKEDNFIRTISFTTEDDKETKVPIVLIHGFGAGVGLWALNLDSLADFRPTYAFDLLGFGRSSRPAFSNSALEAEHQLVQSIEEWRDKMNLKRFILLGHSMGGFLAASYALQYPQRVTHLILADPWGFPERQTNPSHQYQMPVWVKAVATMLKPFNPLVGLRAAGPMGPRLVNRFRPDLRRKFESLVEDETAIPNYVYHCNAQSPSGESAFKSMTAHLGWAKHPMISRMPELNENVPITFIYGSRSWIDRQPGIQLKCMRTNSYVDVQVIQGAGHHVYADRPDQFNSILQSVCNRVDIVAAQKRAGHIKLSPSASLKTEILDNEI